MSPSSTERPNIVRLCLPSVSRAVIFSKLWTDRSGDGVCSDPHLFVSPDINGHPERGNGRPLGQRGHAAARRMAVEAHLMATLPAPRPPFEPPRIAASRDRERPIYGRAGAVVSIVTSRTRSTDGGRWTPRRRGDLGTVTVTGPPPRCLLKRCPVLGCWRGQPRVGVVTGAGRTEPCRC